MLALHRVHADFSAYNVLYWDGDIKIIDFPQAIDPRVNAQAEALLTRDVERICKYLGRFGALADAAALAADLWSRHGG
jgi:RIO kinase 1